MWKTLKNKDLITSLLFALVGAVASMFVATYQVSMFSEEMTHQVINQLGSIEWVIIIAVLQGTILVFLASIFGLKLSRKVNLKLNFLLNKKTVALSSLTGFGIAFFITVSDRIIFFKYLPTHLTEYTFSPLYLMSGILYGGVVEEILLRLFVMSLLIFLLWKSFARKNDPSNIPNWIYIVSIVLSAGLFAAGHLPTTLQTLGSSFPILIRCFVLNGVGGIGFGYLFWKKGLLYSMIAHVMTHVFMQVVLMPILF